MTAAHNNLGPLTLSPLFVLMAFLVLLGLVQTDAEPVFQFASNQILFLVEKVISVAPLLPAIAVVFAAVWPNTRGTTVPKWVIYPFLFVFATTGLAMTLFLSLFTYSGGLIVLAHGTALILSTCAILLHMPVQRPHAAHIALRISALLIPTILACWSLGAGLRVAIQANQLANGKAYCLSSHGDGHAGPIRSIAALRGFSFYTSGGGYKIGDHWYFHGVLLVAGAEDITVYNWSPRRFRFVSVDRPEILIASPKRDCSPIPQFLSHLPLLQ